MEDIGVTREGNWKGRRKYHMLLLNCGMETYMHMWVYIWDIKTKEYYLRRRRGPAREMRRRREDSEVMEEGTMMYMYEYDIMKHIVLYTNYKLLIKKRNNEMVGFA